MILHLWQEEEDVCLYSRSAQKLLRIKAGRITTTSAALDPVGLQCTLLGISGFPNGGYGYLIVCVKSTRIVCSPIDDHAIYRVDKILILTIGQRWQLPQSSSLDDVETGSEDNELRINVQLEYKQASVLVHKFPAACKTILEGHTYYSDSVLLKGDSFHYNHYLARHLTGFAIHLVQGYVGFVKLRLQAEPINLLLVSKRSRHRNGLRYQRRGIDEHGHVANFVETSQITWQHSEIRIFKQIRGSIPLFWTQEPWTLHPVPVVRESHELTRKHYSDLEAYDHVISVNLAESAGREARLTDAFTNSMNVINQELVNFDFHRETAQAGGYDNLDKLCSLLIDRLTWTTTYNDDVLIDDQKQSTIVRTNCVDCLDRTNVVQAKLALSILKDYGEILNMSDFQERWADNGDAIAQQYTSTPALKGDFTRTGKREIRGVINDAKHALKRFYVNMIDDFYGQLVIDSLMGTADDDAVRMFEVSMHTDHQQQQRQRLITLEACKIILGLQCPGWNLLSPGYELLDRMREVVFLLDQSLLYVCAFDQLADKIVQMEVVPIQKLTRIISGVYITSIVHQAMTDPEANYGFMITWEDNETERMLAFKADHKHGKKVVEDIVSQLAEMTGLEVITRDIVGVKDHGVKGLVSIAEHRLYRMIWG